MTVEEYHNIGQTDEPWYCHTCPTATLLEEEYDGAFRFSDSFFSSSGNVDCEENTFDFSDSLFDKTDDNHNDLNLTSMTLMTDDTDTDDENQIGIKQAFKDLKYKYSDKTIIAYLNINSYRYKACDIIDILKGQFIDIMCIAETKLDQTFPDAQFHADNYVLYRRDGASGYSGGLIVYASSMLSTRRRSDLEADLELIVIEQINNSKKSFFYICYRAPRIDAKSYLQVLSKSLDRALIESNDITIIGDINQNMMQISQSNELRDLADLFGLKNLITTPTCYKNPNNHTLVDVLLTNNPHHYCNSGTIQNGLSDVHHFIYGVLRQKQVRQQAKTVTYRSYKSFDPDNFNADLAQVPFHVGAIFDDIDDKYWYFQSLMTEVLDRHAPFKSKRVRPN